MPTDEERGKDLVQHILLADDYLAHLGENAITDRIEPFDAVLQLGCVLAKFRERDHWLFPSSRLSSFWDCPSVPGVRSPTATSAPGDTPARLPTQRARFPRLCRAVLTRSKPGQG